MGHRTSNVTLKVLVDISLASAYHRDGPDDRFRVKTPPSAFEDDDRRSYFNEIYYIPNPAVRVVINKEDWNPLAHLKDMCHSRHSPPLTIFRPDFDDPHCRLRLLEITGPGRLRPARSM
jgi:hypothetical protein